uniref:Uncharacterized protein n=1 Tax=Sexangularia sp. CB-2014 TaxID=1486929 RepID=A0A7S1V2Q0_9EUKA|mmetsp:Transcript_10342/g.32734  ORF Transcript_10342/g.32734 Transcript_10342/m.32734 type:complete len:264 (+) Transcript_10342:383-1174(+)
MARSRRSRGPRRASTRQGGASSVATHSHPSARNSTLVLGRTPGDALPGCPAAGMSCGGARWMALVQLVLAILFFVSIGVLLSEARADLSWTILAAFLLGCIYLVGFNSVLHAMLSANAQLDPNVPRGVDTGDDPFALADRAAAGGIACSFIALCVALTLFLSLLLSGSVPGEVCTSAVVGETDGSGEGEGGADGPTDAQLDCEATAEVMFALAAGAVFASALVNCVWWLQSWRNQMMLDEFLSRFSHRSSRSSSRYSNRFSQS